MLGYLIRANLGALRDGIRSPLAWAGVVLACLGGVVWGGQLDRAVEILLRLPAGSGMASLVGASPAGGSVRWINIGASLPWLRVVLPGLFVFAALGMKRRWLAVGCLLTLAVVWWGAVMLRTVFAVAVAASDAPAAMVTYVAYLATVAATGTVAMITIAAWRRGDILLGVLPAVVLVGGIAGIGALLPVQPQLADGLSLFALGVVVATILASATRTAGLRGRSRAATDGTRPGPFDVFISYRRAESTETARLIATALAQRGLRPFLDIDDLGSHHFDDRLLGAIEAAPDFVLVLAPGSLDGSVEPTDWLRLELAHAIRTGRNIIPIVKEGFVFPERGSLPEEIAELPRYNAIPYSSLYFDAMMDKLERFLVTRRGADASTGQPSRPPEGRHDGEGH